MKKITLKLSAVLTASALVLFGFTGGKLTLKEKIDQAKEVKVYFQNLDIFHSPNTAAVGELRQLVVLNLKKRLSFLKDIRALPKKYCKC